MKTKMENLKHTYNDNLISITDEDHSSLKHIKVKFYSTYVAKLKICRTKKYVTPQIKGNFSAINLM